MHHVHRIAGLEINIARHRQLVVLASAGAVQFDFDDRSRAEYGIAGNTERAHCARTCRFQCAVVGERRRGHVKSAGAGNNPGNCVVKGCADSLERRASGNINDTAIGCNGVDLECPGICINGAGVVESHTYHVGCRARHHPRARIIHLSRSRPAAVLDLVVVPRHRERAVILQRSGVLLLQVGVRRHRRRRPCIRQRRPVQIHRAPAADRQAVTRRAHRQRPRRTDRPARPRHVRHVQRAAALHRATCEIDGGNARCRSAVEIHCPS